MTRIGIPVKCQSFFPGTAGWISIVTEWQGNLPLPKKVV